MRIVSLNAWGGAMYEPLAAWLPTCGADVLCLQEVTRTPGLGGWTEFEDAERQLPQRANLFADVASHLPTHRVWFAASDTGPVRSAGGSVHRQEFGLGTAISDHMTVIGHRESFVHGEHAGHAEWPADGRPRVAQGFRVADPASDRVVTVVQLHGVRDANGKGDTPARARQAEKLRDFVEELRHDDDLVVVCGDFNLLPDSHTFEVLAEVGLTDLVGDADTRTSRYTKPVRSANYVLVSDPELVRRLEILIEPEMSDHRALVLDL